MFFKSRFAFEEEDVRERDKSMEEPFLEPTIVTITIVYPFFTTR